MTDTTISYNTAGTTGGGVYVNANTSTFTLHSGIISYNGANGGAGGGVYSNGVFTMLDGEICYNSSTGNGGGLASGSSGSINLTDGLIANNQSDALGHDLRASNSGGITISDDFLIYNDDASNSISITATANIDVDRILSYDANGGTGDVPSSSVSDNTTSNSEVCTVTVAETTLTAPTSSTSFALVFGGWNTKADGTGTNYLPGEEISIYTTTILYANWKEALPYVLTLDYNYPDGTIETKTVTIIFGSTVTDLPTPTFFDSDATFKGWFIDDKQIQNGDLWSYESDMTATAKWNLWYVNTEAQLQNAVDNAEEGDIVKIIDDITLTSIITTDVSNYRNVTLSFIGEKADGTKPTITSGSATTAMFNIGGTGSNGNSTKIGTMTLTFDNIIFSVTGSEVHVIDTGCYGNTGAVLTITNCEFYENVSGSNYAGRVVNSTRMEVLLFENNLVSGQFDIPLYLVMNTSSSTRQNYADITIQNNYFYGSDSSSKNSSEVIQLYFTTTDDTSDHVVNINSNIFENYTSNTFAISMLGSSVVIDLEHSTAKVDLNVEYNVFLDVTYAFRLSSTATNQTGFDFGLNYFEDTYPKGLRGTSTYSASSNPNNLEFNDYYKRADTPNITVTADRLQLDGFDFVTTGTIDGYTYYTGPYYYVIALENDIGEIDELWRVYQSGIEPAAKSSLANYDVIDPTVTTAIDIQSDWYGQELTIYKVSIDPNLPEGALGSTTVNADLLLSSDMTLALQLDVPYIVTFDVDGDTTMEASQKVDYGNTATEPTSSPTTTLEGYSFNGWYTEATGGQLWDFSDVITENITLYAQLGFLSRGSFLGWGNFFFPRRRKICISLFLLFKSGNAIMRVNTEEILR